MEAAYPRSMEELREGECPVCLKERRRRLGAWVVFPCSHSVCTQCLCDLVRAELAECKCPLCRRPLLRAEQRDKEGAEGGAKGAGVAAMEAGEAGQEEQDCSRHGAAVEVSVDASARTD